MRAISFEILRGGWGKFRRNIFIFFADPSTHMLYFLPTPWHIFIFSVTPPHIYFSTGPSHIFSYTFQDLKWNSRTRHIEDYSIWDPPHIFYHKQPPLHIFQDSIYFYRPWMRLIGFFFQGFFRGPLPHIFCWFPLCPPQDLKWNSPESNS